VSNFYYLLMSIHTLNPLYTNLIRALIYRIRLRAMVDLEEGQPLHHSYTYTLDGTAQRQKHLKQGKFFSCKCDRCLDPTELGTHFSSLKCGQCAEGYQVPREPTGEHQRFQAS